MTITNGVLNFSQVADGVWRGGQPTDEGWKYLQSIGVCRSVKLNLEHGDEPASNFGISVVPCGIDFVRQLVGPVDRAVIRSALSAIVPGTYIHCEHGQDRTGLVVACYRYGTGWSKEQAESEMIALRFHKVLLGLWEFWENYQL